MSVRPRIDGWPLGIIRRYVLPLLPAVALLVAWDLTKPQKTHWAEDDQSLAPRVSASAPAWNDREDSAQRSRENVRRLALAALEQPDSILCQTKGRRLLIENLEHYFYRRAYEERDYGRRGGKEGRDYVARQWSTANDNRIERLVQELTERGLLNPADARPEIAAHLAALTKDVRVRSTPCGN